jgi:hypothetical protein
MIDVSNLAVLFLVVVVERAVVLGVGELLVVDEFVVLVEHETRI